MKRVLMLASVPSMIGQFNMDNISILQELGYKVYVACNFKDRSVWNKEKIEQFKIELEEKGIQYFQIDFSRNPFNVVKNILSFKQTKNVMTKGKFEIVHCHTPVASAIARIAVHSLSSKIIYTAHGFHFYSGAAKKNWLVFYPIEKFLSQYTDVLITINKEDFYRARKRFQARKVLYVPGVGIDTGIFCSGFTDVSKQREKLGFACTDIVLLSVGKSNYYKTNEFVIKAIKKLGNPQIKYIVCKENSQGCCLDELIKEYHLESQVQLLNSKTDLSEFYQVADLFLYPSNQEDVPLPLLEAIACQVPVMCSDNQTNRNFVEDEKVLFHEDEIDEFIVDLKKIATSRENLHSVMRKFALQNYENLKSVDLEQVIGDLSILNDWKWLKRISLQQEFKKDLGIAFDTMILMSVGELNRNKNHSVVIKALAELRDKKIHYCIVGIGTLVDELMKLTKELDVGRQVHFLGYRDDVPELLQKVDAYVLPSLREGLNVSLMEAMASGLPCICSDIRGNRDLIKENGGYRVRADNVQDYCKAIKNLKEKNEFFLMGYHNSKAIRRFSKNIVHKLMYDVYTNLVEY